jgi:hypothetical protein
VLAWQILVCNSFKTRLKQGWVAPTIGSIPTVSTFKEMIPMEAIIFSSLFTSVVGYGYYRVTHRPTPNPIDLAIQRRAENEAARKSPQYSAWRLAVLKRDGFRCVWCKATDNLEVDHVYPFAYFPELRFEITNGRTLCQYHHKQTITYGTGSRVFYEQLKSRI